MKLSRLIHFSRLIASDSVEQIRSYLEYGYAPVNIDIIEWGMYHAMRYLKHRGLFIERLYAASQVRAHIRPHFSDVLRDQDNFGIFFGLTDLNKNSIEECLSDSWNKLGGNVSSRLETTGDLESFLVGFSAYCDAVATETAYREFFGEHALTKRINIVFSSYLELPYGKFANIARFHCRQFALAEKLYPWRETAYGMTVSEFYPMAIIQTGFGIPLDELYLEDESGRIPIEGIDPEEDPEDPIDEVIYIAGAPLMELELDIDEHALAKVQKILGQLQERIIDWEWDDFIEEFTEEGYQSGPGALFGDPDINVIPGDHFAPCSAYVFALASGIGRKRTSLGNVLKRLTEHLLRCENKTEVAVLITDTVDPKTMADSRTLFEIHREKGIQFVLIMVRGGRLTQVPFF